MTARGTIAPDRFNRFGYFMGAAFQIQDDPTEYRKLTSDHVGTSSLAGRDVLTIDVEAQVKLHIELVWFDDETDLDIHYRSPGGTFWSRNKPPCGASDQGTDVHFCVPNPDWGAGAGGLPDGNGANDPSLDVDYALLRLHGYEAQHGLVHAQGPLEFGHDAPFVEKQEHVVVALVELADLVGELALAEIFTHEPGGPTRFQHSIQPLEDFL